MRKLALLLVPVAIAAALGVSGCGAENSASRQNCVTVNPGQVTTISDVKVQMQADQTQKSGKRTVTGAILTLTSQTTTQVDVTVHVRDNYDSSVPDESDVHWGNTTLTPGKDNSLTISAAPYGHEDITSITSVKVCMPRTAGNTGDSN